MSWKWTNRFLWLLFIAAFGLIIAVKVVLWRDIATLDKRITTQLPFDPTNHTRVSMRFPPPWTNKVHLMFDELVTGVVKTNGGWLVTTTNKQQAEPQTFQPEAGRFITNNDLGRLRFPNDWYPDDILRVDTNAYTIFPVGDMVLVITNKGVVRFTINFEAQ